MASGGGKAAPRKDRALLIIAAIACIPVAFIVYWPRLGDFFILDDFFFLNAVRNHGFLELLRRAFTFPEAEPFDEVTLFWRPSVDLYFYAMRPFGLHAQPYHAVNLLLHGGVGALGTVFAYRLTKSAFGAAAIGLLFVVAPTSDFAVTWIAEVSELLSAVLIVGALLSYHEFLTAEKHRRGLVGLTVLFVMAAFLTKESAVILVALLPTLALAVPSSKRRRTWREVVLSLAPVLVLGAAFAVAMLLHDALSDGERLHTFGLHMARNLWRYLEWMVFPYRPAEHLALREAGAALFLAMGALTVLLRQRVLAFFFVWTVAGLMPFTGFDEWIELRYTYLATLPFIAFVVSGVATAVQRLPRIAVRPAATALAVAVLVALVITPMRTRDQQAWIARQAVLYEAMVDGVANLCGELPPESHVFVVDAQHHDYGGSSTPAALHLYFGRVHVGRRIPPLIGFVEHRCVIRYDAQDGRYVLVERA
jgi:hypothetical protein